MNKRDIFPLYVGKCKVVDTLVNQKYLYQGCEIHRGKHKAVLQDITSDNGLSGGTMVAPIPDCQLILKRISDMSEEDVNKIAIELLLEWQGVRDYLKSGYALSTKFATDMEITLWLIQNGYALSDEWFTNGIAVEEKTK